MQVSSATTKRKRTILLISALAFLLQSIAPAFQGAMAQTAKGYTETICTMYGQETIFIALEDNQEQSNPNCRECPVCIIQANLNGQPEPYTLLIDARYVLDFRGQIEPLYLASYPLLFPPLPESRTTCVSSAPVWPEQGFHGHTNRGLQIKQNS